MKDVKEIRRQLWQSLDMAYVRMWLFVVAVCVAIFWVMTLFLSPNEYEAGITWLTLGICVGPIVILCGIRTWNIFRHPESYHFCKTNSATPREAASGTPSNSQSSLRMRTGTSSLPTLTPSSPPTKACSVQLCKIMLTAPSPPATTKKPAR